MRLVRENDNILLLDDKNVVILMQNINDIQKIEDIKKARMAERIKQLDSATLLRRYADIVEYYCMSAEEEIDSRMEDLAEVIMSELEARLGIKK